MSTLFFVNLWGQIPVGMKMKSLPVICLISVIVEELETPKNILSISSYRSLGFCVFKAFDKNFVVWTLFTKNLHINHSKNIIILSPVHMLRFTHGV